MPLRDLYIVRVCASLCAEAEARTSTLPAANWPGASPAQGRPSPCVRRFDTRRRALDVVREIAPLELGNPNIGSGRGGAEVDVRVVLLEQPERDLEFSM